MLRHYMLSGSSCWGLSIILALICTVQFIGYAVAVGPLSIVYEGEVVPLELTKKSGAIQLKYICAGAGKEYYTDNLDAILAFVKDPKVRLNGIVYKSGRITLKKAIKSN